MSEHKSAQVVAGIIDFSALRPRRPRMVKASGVLGAIAGIVYGVLAHSTETAIIPLDLLLFGTLSALTAWLLDVTAVDDSSQ